MKFIELLVKGKREFIFFNISQLKNIHFFDNETAELEIEGYFSFNVDARDNLFAKFSHFLSSDLLVFELETL